MSADASLIGQDPLIGNVIAGYQFVKRLGVGTFGVVYLARHPRIKDRLVAVKYLRMSDESSNTIVEREVEILARLQHPNVINIYDTYRFDHYQLIVMELMRGGDLKTVMKSLQKPLAVDFVLEIMETLAYALGYVHGQKIVHLDLKPANILLDPIAEGQHTRFSYTDFGIAKIVNPGASGSTGIAGTPSYMSPEHFGFGDSKPDHRADIYSLGIILYELLIGEVPFASNQFLELLNMHAHAPVPLITDIIPQLPVDIDTILQTALAKTPEERYQSATEMGLALRDVRNRYSPDAFYLPGRASRQDVGELAQRNADGMMSDYAEYPEAGGGAALKLLIMTPTGEQEQAAFSERSVIVGRDKAATLQLKQETISRRHMQIDLDRQVNVFLTDLDSVNGTYLDGVRLTSRERVPWRLNQFVQVEGYLLQLDGLVGEEVPSAPVQSNTERIVELLDELDKKNVKPSVSIDISPAVVYLELGKPQYIQVRVRPQHTPVAMYQLQAKPGPGIDDRWYTLPAGQMINDGDSYNFDLILSMPATSAPGSTTREIALQVISDNPDIPTAYQILKVRVVSFTRYVIVLQPNEVSHHRRRRSHLVIRNEGNQEDTFSIEVESPDTLQVIPASSQVTIPPGESERVKIRFVPRRGTRMKNGRLNYTLSVRTQTGVVQRTSGKYVIRSGRRGLSLTALIVWIVFVVVAVRYFLMGLSLSEQFGQIWQFATNLVRPFTG